MKNRNPLNGPSRRTHLLGALAAACMLPAFAFSQPLTPVNLGSTANFVVLAGSLVSNVPTSAITGNVGLSPAAGSGITGFGLTEVTGTIYTVDATGPSGSVQDASGLSTAKGDLTIAFNDAAGRTPVPSGTFLNPGSGNIGGSTLVAGLYKFSGAASITGSDLTLSGSATDVWIFQIGTTLTVGNGIHVVLTGGAQAANVFWQVGTSATLGTTVIFKGTILADQTIALGAGATLSGRALARIAAVTLSSNIITKPSLVTIPGAPTGVSGVAGDAQVSVTWIAPASNGGSTITAYTATAVQDTSKHCATTGALTCIVTALTNGAAYTFTVTATNSAGISAGSALSSAVIPIGIPGAPTAVTGTAADAQVSVSWIAPLSNGGSAITAYTATAVQDTSKHCATTGALTCNVTTLTNGTAYTFTVTAKSAAGTSVASALSASIVPVGVPGIPTGVTAVAGNAQASVSWIAPALSGGSAITAYTVKTTQDTTKTCTTTGALNCVVSGLTVGTAYTFTVTATNAAGTGSLSALSAAVTPVGVPGVPTSVTAVTGNAQISVSWIAPASIGGSAITAYTATAVQDTTKHCATTGALTCIVTALTNGTAYTFTVKATNAVGIGAASALSAAVIPAGAPGAPTALAATVGVAQASLTWLAPVSNGGAAITAYTARAVQDTSKHCTTTGALTCIVTALANGTSYTFTVTAANSAGTSVASALSIAVTTGIKPLTEKTGFGIHVSGSTVQFHLPSSAANAQISVMDVWGRTVWSGTPGQNANDLSWNGITRNGHDAGSGIYLVRLTTADTHHHLLSEENRRIVYNP